MNRFHKAIVNDWNIKNNKIEKPLPAPKKKTIPPWWKKKNS